MSLTIEDVRKIAQLARVELSPEEEKRHALTMSTILEFIKTLNELDTTDVEPTAQVTGLEDVSREDVARECPNKKGLLEQMPLVSGELLKVPAVFSDSEDVI